MKAAKAEGLCGVTGARCRRRRRNRRGASRGCFTRDMAVEKTDLGGVPGLNRVKQRVQSGGEVASGGASGQILLND